MLTPYQIGLLIGQNKVFSDKFWAEDHSHLRYPFKPGSGYSNNDLQDGALDGEILANPNLTLQGDDLSLTVGDKVVAAAAWMEDRD